LKLSNAAFNAVDQQIRPVDAATIPVLQDGQIPTVLGGSQHTESESLRAIQDPLRLLILCDVREDLLLATRVGLTCLSESRVDTETEPPPLAGLKPIEEITHVADEHSTIG